MCLAVVASVAVAGADPPRAELTHFVCRHAQNPKHREIAVTAVMRPLPGTEQMEIKFSLLRQPAGSPSFAQVHSGDLDKWIRPQNPTLGQRPADVWKLQKVVTDLAGTAAYRLRATFRWTGGQHRVLGRAVRITTVCRAD